MDINIHEVGEFQIAEVTSEGFVINDKEEGLDLLGNLYYHGFDHVILYKTNITPNFFDLKTGIAGEILQKFSNYRVKLAIIGDFATHQSKSLQNFIFESNKLGHINFSESLEEAIRKFSNK
ncbi:uncharacterized protein DUF4180 [Roseivirga ehrenbergii]|uniref:Alpha/beta hydrolase n=1 Tax=Roseivirga ehrenbergii (strain DSM 102268 / JCM 13514 / KCTC 12282 / NCIMB 14502 / KMM 6017) TaxID=279360 RepID=A0A150X753_ROSEK|nr:DUF4180 domain-containing protein [Roseivirga ehrenbergii]KYG74533.1 alpha/beta hydrolase [Roseivirga ehrenbergii]TCL14155.1 uncharacterized protein DUF4180 [Roseivirga ehrenbergii]